MAQRKYTIVVPKRILEGSNDDTLSFEVFAKDTKQAIKRAAQKALESDNYFKEPIQDDWRWQHLKMI